MGTSTHNHVFPLRTSPGDPLTFILRADPKAPTPSPARWRPIHLDPCPATTESSGAARGATFSVNVASRTASGKGPAIRPPTWASAWHETDRKAPVAPRCFPGVWIGE